MYPCPWPGNESPALYTFYAIATLTVVVLAICLVWSPFVNLVREINTIFARVIIYMNKEMFGINNACFFSRVEGFLTSQTALCSMTLLFIVFALYLASGDFLRFAGCYVCNWPDNKALKNIKKQTLEVIEYLLNLTGNLKGERSTGNETVNIRRGAKDVNDRRLPETRGPRQVRSGRKREFLKRSKFR